MKHNHKLFFFSLWGPQRNINIAGIKKCSPGFTLIELIVATLIASMLSGVLLTALYQSSRVQLSVDNVIDISERIGIVANQLEKDLAGAFVPAQAEEKGDEKSAETSGEKANAQKGADEKKSAEKKSDADQKPGKKKEQKKPIEKIFYSTNKNGMLDTLTFVTNNPLVVFVSKDVGVVKPKVVRVQYTLKPEQGNKDSYALFRQESNELDLAEYKNVRPYEVIGGIKKLTMSFTARIEKKEEKKSGEQKSQEKQKKSYEYKVQPDWVSEQKKDANKDSGAQADKKEPEFPRVPYSVECKMTLWDKQSKKEKDFTFICHIPVDSIEAKIQDKKQAEPAPAPKEEQKSGNGAKPGQQPQQNVKHTKQVQSEEIVVYNGIETLANTLDSLKKILGNV